MDIKQKYKNEDYVEDAFELFDVSKTFEEFENRENKTKTSATASLFPEDEETMRNVIKIQNTIRVMPHD